MNGDNRIEVEDEKNAVDDNWFTGSDISANSDNQKIEDQDKKISQFVQEVEKFDAGNCVLTNKIEGNVLDSR